MSNCAIFDIGKTNKKCFVFDEEYRIVFEKSEVLPETIDEDGFPCEDIDLLSNWVQTTLGEVLQMPNFQVKALNFSAYGASFVYLDMDGKILTPLYNYLKPYPESLAKQFNERYGEKEKMAIETASPLLGSLNAGMQLFRLKNENPDVYDKVKYALHLPQYISHLVSSDCVAEITSIGCHTMLWDFNKMNYHDWVINEGVSEKFPPIVPADIHFSNPRFPGLKIGTGLHDSSAALIPYLAMFDEPFVLLSTGTWCISMNPFNDEPLTLEELSNDCLCYLTHQGRQVKAARYFGGHEHEQAVNKLATSFGADVDFYKELSSYEGSELLECYLDFMRQLIDKQVVSTKLAIGSSQVRKIYVDGGFSRNEIFMNLLAEAFPGLEVFAADVAQASALGAAMVMHPTWNHKALPSSLISLKNYSKI
ncbi:MAG: carbohydrate kinase [Saprospiraceae bacterium]|nr:carbohydrate kinase [Saprospiraceae bacterium]MCF8250399.1 carbohydrate kinase [Saprospiraceae bacterium]MCF8281531.1 hypothetical protein [Bacteroidales bacterium]MCF8312226.1 carbohydrate kinase [Saprospiraceae bacterium]MCF8440567.1 carbohydrate kinase [Saprospiraceae bacterium]